MDNKCCRESGKFLLGVVAGTLAGVAIGVTMCPSRREIKKMSNKAAKQMSEMVEHLSDMMVG